MKTVQLLEVTLRDGSYAIDFAFTPSDTEQLCRGLENAGVRFIEIGHGVGLGASGDRYGRAAASDVEYMRAARKVLKKASYGMFCIPGIASLDDLDVAKKYGMGFVRIGTDVTEVELSEAFVKRAKRHKMFVATNYMKSYALPPKEFAKRVKLSVSYGADMAYVVDSAGSMTPDDVVAYYRAVRRVADIPLGFHGHDNLGLATANSLAAADVGYEFVDSSLQGLGRSAGNACTEVLALALLKRGFKLSVDYLKLFRLGQTRVRPLMANPGRAPLDIMCGFAGFHSSYMPQIQEVAARYRVDPARLILGMAKIDQVNLDVAKLEAVAKRLPRTDESFHVTYGFGRYAGKEQLR